MKAPSIQAALTAASVFILAGDCFGANTSPSDLPTSTYAEAEKRESLAIYPQAQRALTGKNAIILGTASPIALESGIEALKNGGTAADTAATVALTQVTTQLGSVVSFAGVMSLVYYDAASKHVYSMDAGYNSYLHEHDPKSIPVCDLGPLNTYRSSTPNDDRDKAKGRETLVPGFMAGIEAMHQRFGKLPFADLFQPAIWYAEHGIVINPPLQAFFSMREKFLARTPEGQQFMHQAGTALPKCGDRFVQPRLAVTLRNVARHGAQEMYTGTWGKHFVQMIGREGGKVCAEDMRRYQVIWSEPFSTTYLGDQVFTAGPPSNAAYHLLTGLNLAEALGLERRGNYWEDPTVLRDLQTIDDVTNTAPSLDGSLVAFLKTKGLDCSPSAQLTKQYATMLIPLLDQFHPAASTEPHHSNSIIVIDKDGNIAAVTHTINTVVWGDTGIVVDGIPIPDAAGFQQEALASIKPGDRLPNDMMPAIILKDGKPVLATSAIGMSLIPETLKTIIGLIGKNNSLESLQKAPAILNKPGTPNHEKPTDVVHVAVPQSAYDQSFLEQLKGLNVSVELVPAEGVGALRGTVSAVTIDPSTGEKGPLRIQTF